MGVVQKKLVTGNRKPGIGVQIKFWVKLLSTHFTCQFWYVADYMEQI